MKLVYYSLAVLTILAAGYAFVQLMSVSFGLASMDVGHLQGFGDNGQSDPAYDKLVETFNRKIALYKADSEKYREYGMWVSLGITVLTASSTLMATLKAAKSEAATSKFVQVIAVLAFLSTIASWGNTQLTSQKSEYDQKMQKCRDEKIAFYTNYEKVADFDAQRKLIRLYEDKLVDL